MRAQSRGGILPRHAFGSEAASKGGLSYGTARGAVMQEASEQREEVEVKSRQLKSGVAAIPDCAASSDALLRRPASHQ